MHSAGGRDCERGDGDLQGGNGDRERGVVFGLQVVVSLMALLQGLLLGLGESIVERPEKIIRRCLVSV